MCKDTLLSFFRRSAGKNFCDKFQNCQDTDVPTMVLKKDTDIFGDYFRTSFDDNPSQILPSFQY